LEQTGHFSVLTKKPISPTDDEARSNPRARSAKLRVIFKRDAAVAL
jgi:16S rRNA C1402 N4-methylase RsmH